MREEDTQATKSLPGAPYIEKYAPFGARITRHTPDGIYASGSAFTRLSRKEKTMLILLIILLVLMFGSFPTWPHSRNWGYYPSGGLGLILAIVLIVMLLDHGL